METFYRRRGEWKTVAEALQVHTVAELALLASVAAVPSCGRKAERIAELCRALEGERLRFLLGRLSPLQRAAVAMAVHSLDGRLSADGFRIRYGVEPDFGKSSFFGLSEPSLLCLFIHGDRVPDDLRFRLRAIVPPPDSPPIRVVETLPRFVDVTLPPYGAANRSGKELPWRHELRTVERAQDAAVELFEVLHLIEARAVALTPKKGVPSTAALRPLKRVLAAGADFLDLVPKPKVPRSRETAIDFGAIRAFAWPRILLAGGLARARAGTLVVTPDGSAALQAPPAQTVRRLFKAWIESGEPDELLRISGVRGARSRDVELTAPSVRRRAIAAGLADCPVGEWVTVDAFLDHIRVSGRDFAVTRTPAVLRVDSFDSHRSGLEGWDASCRWLVLQGRIVLCFLFEYAATLGLVDVAYSSPLHARSDVRELTYLEMISRYDGLYAFRLTELGAFSLGKRSEAPSVRAAPESKLRLGDDLEIHATGPISASHRVLLGRCAELVREGLWSLSRRHILESVSTGWSLTRLREFLERSAGRPLPPAVEAFLDDCARRARSVRRAGTARVLECRDAEVAEAIASDPRTSEYCPRAGERTLVVPLESEASFYRALRVVGFGVDRVLRGRGESQGVREEPR